jgi:uncharacterized damage-inducible protein DinB
MKLTDYFLAELDSEAAISRRVLERVPDGRYDWKPHASSMGFGYLAELVARIPSWASMAIDRDELELRGTGGGSSQMAPLHTSSELVAELEKVTAGAKASLSKTTDDHLMTPWRLMMAGKAVLEQPRYLVIRDLFNHAAHHRGQLSVYLRLNGAKIPSIYGPSADDQRFG